MFYIEDDKIFLTKGDYGRLSISLTDGDGEAYEMQDGDVLTFTVRKRPQEASAVVLQVSSLIPSIVITPEDTASADAGEYSADCQITMADGKRFTFWPRLEGDNRTKDQNFKNFTLMPEVTMV